MLGSPPRLGGGLLTLSAGAKPCYGPTIPAIQQTFVGPEQPVALADGFRHRAEYDGAGNALFRASVLGSTPQPEFLVFHGEAGSLYMCGVWVEDDRIQRLMVGQQDWEDVPIAEAITAGLPQAANPLQRCWNQFFREFVADVKAEGYAGYPTFHDGYAAAAVIDVARKGYDWKALHSRE